MKIFSKLCIGMLLYLMSYSAFSQSGFRSREVLEALNETDDAISVRNMTSINTELNEFSPVYYQNGLVFVSQYRNGPVDRNGNTFLKLFYAELDPNLEPQDPRLFSFEINSPLHEGPVCFNSEADKIYFTKSNLKKGAPKKGADRRVHLQLYEANRGPYDWENIQKLPFNEDDYDYMNPSLSADGNKLFFASNREDGFGGIDLYFVQRQGDNSWSAPINLGPDVNTPGDETFPFIHHSGVLFFSSSGHEGLGGYDLFMVDMNKNRWEVINLGRPFNSTEDDLSIILDKVGTQGFFTSAKSSGFGANDIYKFNAPEGIKGKKLAQSLVQQIQVVDAERGQPISKAMVRKIELSPDGLFEDKKNYDVEVLPGTATGELKLQLVQKKGQNIDVPYVYTNDHGFVVSQFVEQKSYMIMVSKSGYISSEMVFSADGKKSNRPIVVELQPSNCLELNGFVRDELTGAPISGVRIKVLDHCEDKEETIITNSEGAFFHCLSIGCNFELIAEKAGYQIGTSFISTINIRGSRSVDSEILLREQQDTGNSNQWTTIQLGTVIVLDKIFYDFGKTIIRKGAARDLEALVKLMNQYPTMEIELGAHTDSQGDDEFNLGLSLDRAESAKDFLVRRGIAGHRIKAIGYGEAFIRNHCYNDVDCTDEEHGYNRRVEVRVTSIQQSRDIRTPKGKGNGNR